MTTDVVAPLPSQSSSHETIEHKLNLQSSLSEQSLDEMRSVCDRLGSHCQQLLHHHHDNNNNDDNTLQRMLHNGMDMLLDLKMVHRQVSQHEKRIRDIARECYGRSSALELKLQNMNFEAHNLQDQIEQCREFVSRHESIELCSMDEFRQNAPRDLVNDQQEQEDAMIEEDVDDDEIRGDKEHQFTLRRLQFELEERKRLLKENENANLKKKEMIADNEKRNLFLKGLHHNVKAISDASKPLQEYMKVDYYSNHTLNELARQLSTPLYVLFNSIVFYRDNYDATLEVQIDGDIGRTKSYWDGINAEDNDSNETQREEQQAVNIATTTTTIQENSNEEDQQARSPKRARIESLEDDNDNDDDIFMDYGEDEEDQEEKQKQSSSSTTTTTDAQRTMVQLTQHQINKLLEVFPLSIKMIIKVPFSDKEKSVTLIFSYLPRANLVLVREQNFRVLHRLFPDDTGIFTPNIQVLAGYNFSDSPAGKPYKWAQWVAGLDFLEPIGHESTITQRKAQSSPKYNITTMIELIKYKIRASRLLNRQLRNLEEKRSLPVHVTSSSRAGFSPGSSVTLNSFQQMQQSADTQKRTFVCLLSRGEVQVEAKIDLPWMDYPVTTPQFQLKFRKGQPEMNWDIPHHLESFVTDKAALDVRKRSASYDTSLRDIENEVNINTPLRLHVSSHDHESTSHPSLMHGEGKVDQEDEEPFYLLSFQLARLMVCIDVFFSNDQNKIANFLQESRQRVSSADEEPQVVRKHAGRLLHSHRPSAK